MREILFLIFLKTTYAWQWEKIGSNGGGRLTITWSIYHRFPWNQDHFDTSIQDPAEGVLNSYFAKYGYWPYFTWPVLHVLRFWVGRRVADPPSQVHSRTQFVPAHTRKHSELRTCSIQRKRNGDKWEKNRLEKLYNIYVRQNSETANIQNIILWFFVYVGAIALFCICVFPLCFVCFSYVRIFRILYDYIKWCTKYIIVITSTLWMVHTTYCLL